MTLDSKDFELSAQSTRLATRIFKHVRDRDAIQVTDVLFDEHQLRAEKLEYLLVADAKGKILAHTFLRPIPADINVVARPWPTGKGQNIQVIESPTIFVTDVAVPIFEGIVPIGSVHVGLRGEYLEALKTDVKRLTLVATLAVGLLATVIALVLTRLIVRPLQKLTAVALELSNANLDVTMPDIKSHDEIRDLADAISGVMAALATLMAELQPETSSASASHVTNVAPGSGNAEVE